MSILKQVEKFDKKQNFLMERKEKFNKRKLAREQQELVYYQFLKFFKCVKIDEEDIDKEDASKNNKNQVMLDNEL